MVIKGGSFEEVCQTLRALKNSERKYIIRK